MSESKEGAPHPLTTRAVENGPAEPPRFVMPPHAGWAALGSYLIGYLYITAFFANDADWIPANLYYLLFAVLYLAGVELFARAAHRTPCRETPLWAVCYLVLGVLFALHGSRSGDLGLWQHLLWHLYAIWFALARTGMLAAGQSGILAPLDGLAGCITLPFGGFFLRARTVFGCLRERLRQREARKINGKTVLTVLGSILLAVMLTLFAWEQLCAADSQFAAFGSDLRAFLNAHFWDNARFMETFVKFLLSLPVGAWLYGLVANGLRRTAPPVPQHQFYAALSPFAVLPVYSVGIVTGALCCLYALFFGVQTAELAGVLASPALTAPEASALAVEGFWELCRVQLMNFCLLAAARFLVPQLRGKRAARIGLAVFCSFGVLFAALAGGKLALYMVRFGLTPRRIVSAWFSGVLAVWGLLALVWCLLPQRKIPAARWGLYLLAVTFTLLCCVNLNKVCLQDYFARLEADGVSAQADSVFLWQCGYYDNPHFMGQLLDEGWFEGKSEETIQSIYENSQHSPTAPEELTVRLESEGKVLRFAFAEGRCIAAEWQ